MTESPTTQEATMHTSVYNILARDAEDALAVAAEQRDLAYEFTPCGIVVANTFRVQWTPDHFIITEMTGRAGSGNEAETLLPGTYDDADDALAALDTLMNGEE